jgi:polar amino acid transport system substrate-binding protein
MLRIVRLLFAAFLAYAPIAGAEQKAFTVVADPWCPFNCEQDGDNPGIMIELASIALAQSGFYIDYSNINWARAAVMVIDGERNGIVGMGKSVNTQNKFHFHEIPLAFSQVCFYRKSGSQWTFEGVSSLKDQRIGRINKVKYGNIAIDSWLETEEGKLNTTIVSGEGNLLERIILMLETGRISTFGEVRTNVDYTLKSINTPADIEIAGCLPNIDDLYIASTLNAPQSIAFSKALDEGLAKLLKDPAELQLIFDQYNMSLTNYLENLKAFGLYPNAQ